MVSLMRVVREDLKAAKDAFRAGDYELLNIYANRLMGNALYGEPKSAVLLGFFLKEVAVDLVRVEGEEADKERAEASALECIAAIEHAASEDEIDSLALWTAYHGFVSETAPLALHKTERDAYKESHEYSRQVMGVLASGFLVGASYMNTGSLSVVKGVLHEGSRVIRTYGVDKHTLALYCVADAFDRLFDYLVRESTPFEDEIDDSGLREAVEPHMANVSEFVNHWKDSSDDSVLTKASQLICELALEWRRMFVMNPLQPKAHAPPESRRITLPQETRDKIGKTLLEAFRDKRPADKGAPGRGKKK